MAIKLEACRSLGRFSRKSSCRALPTPSPCSTQSGIPILDSIRTTQKYRRQSRGRARPCSGSSSRSAKDGNVASQPFMMSACSAARRAHAAGRRKSTGGLDKALLNVSYFYNRDVKESVEQGTDPDRTDADRLFMGALLGWIMLSVHRPDLRRDRQDQDMISRRPPLPRHPAPDGLRLAAWASCSRKAVFEMRTRAEYDALCTDYLARPWQKSHFQMLANVAEEGHEQETIPVPAGQPTVKALITRKLGQHFPRVAAGRRQFPWVTKSASARTRSCCSRR